MGPFDRFNDRARQTNLGEEQQEKRSAAANAENNYNMDPRALRITLAQVSEGEKLRRMRPRARGRGDMTHRRRSNLTIVVEEDSA